VAVAGAGSTELLLADLCEEEARQRPRDTDFRWVAGAVASALRRTVLHLIRGSEQGLDEERHRSHQEQPTHHSQQREQLSLTVRDMVERHRDPGQQQVVGDIIGVDEVQAAPCVPGLLSSNRKTDDVAERGKNSAPQQPFLSDQKRADVLDIRSVKRRSLLAALNAVCVVLRVGARVGGE
jgi:hypothetical protein